MGGEPVRQLKQLQEENQRLKRLLAELTLDKTMLQDVLAKNSKASATPSGGGIPAWRLGGERAARVRCHPVASRNLSLPEPQGSAHRAADEDAGDRRAIAQPREHEVDRGAGGVDGSAEIAPTALDTNVGLIDTPGLIGWLEMTAQPLL